MQCTPRAAEFLVNQPARAVQSASVQGLAGAPSCCNWVTTVAGTVTCQPGRLQVGLGQREVTAVLTLGTEVEHPRVALIE